MHTRVRRIYLLSLLHRLRLLRDRREPPPTPSLPPLQQPLDHTKTSQRSILLPFDPSLLISSPSLPLGRQPYYLPYLLGLIQPLNYLFNASSVLSPEQP